MDAPSVLLGTTNEQKQKEWQFFLKPHLDLVFSQGQDCPETGLSFFENAWIKARYYRQMYPHYQWILSEDTGLCLPALQGFPGLYSHRYQNHKSQQEKNALIAQLMQIFPPEERIAEFVGCAVLYHSEHQWYCVEKSFSGKIVSPTQGEHFFGYNSIFFDPVYNKVLAQMSLEEKQHHTHRGQLADTILTLFNLNQKE